MTWEPSWFRITIRGWSRRPLLTGIRKVIEGRPIFTCVDPKQRDFSVYQGFDIVTPNHHEAGHAAGEEMQSGQDHIRVGMKLLQQYDFKALLMTRGEEGMSLFERNGRMRHTAFPAEAREVFDVTGAGDTVIGVSCPFAGGGGDFPGGGVSGQPCRGNRGGEVGHGDRDPGGVEKGPMSDPQPPEAVKLIASLFSGDDCLLGDAVQRPVGKVWKGGFHQRSDAFHLHRLLCGGIRRPT